MGQRRELVIGIDVGQEGYLCVYDGHKIRVMWAIPYEDNGKTPDIYRIKKMFTTLAQKNLHYSLIETQQVFSKQGAVSAWHLSAGYYSLLNALEWSDTRWDKITPTEWKRALEIPVPEGDEFVLPKLTKRPGVPKKPKIKEHKVALKVWERMRKVEEKARARVNRLIKVERKRLACERAQIEQPNYDFRVSKSKNATKPHSGKCEAFLIALLAWQRLRTGL